MIPMHLYACDHLQSCLIGKDHQLLEQVTVQFSPTNNFKYADIPKIADFISTRKGLKRVTFYIGYNIRPRDEDGSSTLMYALASMLAQTIKPHLRKKEFVVNITMQFLASFLDPCLHFDETVTFLSSSAAMITGLRISPVQNIAADACAALAAAVASLENLKELGCGKWERHPVGANFLQTVLLESIHQDKLRLETLDIYAFSLPGLAAFLASDCACSSLKKLVLHTAGFDRLNSMELKAGLLQNNHISELELSLDPCGQNIEGLPILFEYLDKDLSVDSFQLGGGRKAATARTLLLALESNTGTTLKTLRLGTSLHRNSNGEEFRHFLLGNQRLQCLELTDIPIEALENQQFRHNLAEGLNDNQSLRSIGLGIEEIDEQDPNSPLDLSGIIDSLSDRDGPNQCEDLTVAFGHVAVTASTWESLANLLQAPQCPLTLLDVRFDYGGQDDILGLVKSIKDAPNLKKATVAFTLFQGGFDFSAFYDVVFESGSRSLRHLDIELSYDGFDELEEEEQEEIRTKVLAHMETNNHLESVELYPTEGDTQFDLALKSFCTRNKASNAGKGLEDGSLEPTALPTILEDIEKDCHVLGESTDVHFVNIWFSLFTVGHCSVSDTASPECIKDKILCLGSIQTGGSSDSHNRRWKRVLRHTTRLIL